MKQEKHLLTLSFRSEVFSLTFYSDNVYYGLFGGGMLSEGKEIGKITHYFSKISVAVIELIGTLKTGETIHIKGATTDFKQKVDSMQIEHKAVPEAKKGQSIGMKVAEPVREHDQVFVVEE